MGRFHLGLGRVGTVAVIVLGILVVVSVTASGPSKNGKQIGRLAVHILRRRGGIARDPTIGAIRALNLEEALKAYAGVAQFSLLLCVVLVGGIVLEFLVVAFFGDSARGQV